MKKIWKYKNIQLWEYKNIKLYKYRNIQTYTNVDLEKYRYEKFKRVCIESKYTYKKLHINIQ